MTQEKILRKWRIFAPLGLATIGAGISIVGHAIALKTMQAGVWEWFAWGTMGLILTNAGIAVFGEAVKCRVLYELYEMIEFKQELK
jgi:multidrug transporter EmrE-like cation transporter